MNLQFIKWKLLHLKADTLKLPKTFNSKHFVRIPFKTTCDSCSVVAAFLITNVNLVMDDHPEVA